jgi:hypothetical protein
MARETLEYRTAVVATFNEREDAEAVAKRLIQAGFQAEVADETKVQKFFFMSKPLANEKVEVPIEDYDRARNFLKQIDPEEHLLRHQICCPQCDSPDIEYPQFTRKFITPVLVEIACFLHILEKQFYCKNCHNTWSRKVGVPPPLDVLNWRRDRLVGPQ